MIDELFAYEVNPQSAPIAFNRSDAGLELWMMFCIMVAGKSASITRRTLQAFIEDAFDDNDPSHLIKKYGSLRNALEANRVGQYNRLEKAFNYLAEHFNADKLRTATVEELEQIPGVGPKTARFFLLTTREGARYAALDTHLLKYLRTPEAAQFLQAVGYVGEVPKATPSGKKYAQLEKAVLMAAAAKGQTPAEFDYEVWARYYKER
jgi:thermostable 8-oxoguanine DNA glycosylase